MVDYVGEDFGRYTIVRPLDDEHDLVTSLAWDTHQEVYCALVRLYSMAEAGPQTHERFLTTMQALSMLDHPQIVPYQGYGVEDGIPYLVRPYMPGGTLKQRLRLLGPIAPTAVLDQIAPVITALDYLHEQNITHFGLRPHVMLRDETGELHLAEAGITPLALRPAQLPEGLRPYSAPELYLRVPYTNTVDIYSLGAIVYEMVTGRPPFNGATYVQQMEAHLNRRIPPTEEMNPDLPASLTAVLSRAMEKSPYLRYQTAQAFYIALVEAIRGEHAAATLKRDMPKNGRSSQSRHTQTFKYASGMSGGANGENPSQIYADALIIQGQDPERARALYHRLIEIAPQRAQGEVIQRLYRLEQDAGHDQVHGLMVEAREARAIGDWDGVEASTHQVLSYDPHHEEARQLYALSVLLSAADVHYGAAYAATTTGNWQATLLLLRELYQAVPDYVDSEQLVSIHAANAHFVTERRAIAAHEAQVLSLSFSPHSTYLATGSTDKTVRLWKMPEAELITVLDDHQTWVCSTIFNPDGETVLAGTWEGLIKLWGVPNGAYAGVVAGQTSQIRAMAFAAHEPTLLATAAGYFLTLWTMPQGKREAVIRESERNPVTSLAFSPTDPWLISGLQDGSMVLRDISTPNLDVLLEGRPHEGPIYAVTVSPDGQLIATASRDGTATLTDIMTGDVLLRLHGHESTVHDVVFNRDGSLLATAGRDHRVILWRVEDGEALAILNGHHDEARSVAFSPDGRVLVSGGADGYIKTWSIL